MNIETGEQFCMHLVFTSNQMRESEPGMKIISFKKIATEFQFPILCWFGRKYHEMFLTADVTTHIATSQNISSTECVTNKKSTQTVEVLNHRSLGPRLLVIIKKSNKKIAEKYNFCCWETHFLEIPKNRKIQKKSTTNHKKLW